MTVLTVGLSYRSAPVSVLERLSIPSGDVPKLLDELLTSDAISEAIIVSTCNRVELYADVSRFHPALADVSALLARVSGIDVGELAEHLYVHFAEAAVEHLFSVAAGLDSMVVGESQILGQLRAAYAVGTETGSVGRVLHELVQSALRTGKTVHTDTGIDRAGASIVSVALDRAEAVLGGLTGRRVLIVGAGSMGALAAATARRRGVGEIVVTSRTGAHAERTAASVDGRAVPMDDAGVLRAEVDAADVVISCTGATGLVLDAADFRPRSERDLVVLDLALPRDVNPAVSGLPGVRYVDLDVLRDAGAMVSDSDVAAATEIVTDRLARYLDEQQQLAVAPTVTALRARASAVIESELRRLDGRLPDLDTGARAEVATAVRRAVEKVLHAPTVRVKELAATPDGGRYAAALRALFDLDPASPETVVAIRAQADSRTSDSRTHDGHTQGSLAGQVPPSSPPDLQEPR
jgi:glutamyl-tRNA reductase